MGIDNILIMSLIINTMWHAWATINLAIINLAITHIVPIIAYNSCQERDKSLKTGRTIELYFLYRLMVLFQTIMATSDIAVTS